MKLLPLLLLLTGCASERPHWFVGGGAGTLYQRPEAYGTAVNFGRTFQLGGGSVDLCPVQMNLDASGRTSYGPLLLFRCYLK